MRSSLPRPQLWQIGRCSSSDGVAVAWCVSLITLISCYASARVEPRRRKSSRTRNGQCLNCDVAAGQADGPNADKSRTLQSRIAERGPRRPLPAPGLCEPAGALRRASASEPHTEQLQPCCEARACWQSADQLFACNGSTSTACSDGNSAAREAQKRSALACAFARCRSRQVAISRAARCGRAVWRRLVRAHSANTQDSWEAVNDVLLLRHQLGHFIGYGPAFTGITDLIEDDLKR
jgi:hypothetical protein